MKTFQSLHISDELIAGLNEIKITEPSEIQELVIPILLNGETDLIAKAQTGTGKTLAFGLPLLMQTSSQLPYIQSIILSPTRELAQQIAKQLFKVTKYVSHKIFVEAVYGGEKIDKQISSLRRPTQILVATPGRLIDLLNRKAVNISQVNTIVLDEADEMLSMGFKADLDKILKYVKNREKLWLFSATISHDIQEIINTYMSDNKVNIELDKADLVNKHIKHEYLNVDNLDKLNVLEKFIHFQKEGRGIIFCNKKAEVKTLIEQLKSKKMAAEALHGDMMQKDREKVMRAFKNEKLQILVSTDVSARGIDVKDLAYVVHFNLPDQLEYFTHRSGRTARAGKSGISFAMISPNQVSKMNVIEKELHIHFQKATFI